MVISHLLYAYMYVHAASHILLNVNLIPPILNWKPFTRKPHLTRRNVATSHSGSSDCRAAGEGPLVRVARCMWRGDTEWWAPPPDGPAGLGRRCSTVEGQWSAFPGRERPPRYILLWWGYHSSYYIIHGHLIPGGKTTRWSDMKIAC